MPSIYNSKREILLKFLKDEVVPRIKKVKDVDYQKLIDFLVLEKGASFKTAKECVDLFIRNGAIKREGEVLTIPDEEIKNWLGQIKSEEKKFEKILENESRNTKEPDSP